MTRLRIQTLMHASFWFSAIVVAVGAVLYAKLVGLIQAAYFQLFHSYPYALSLLSPLGFLGATLLVRHLAPEAKGSGIPQVLQAIDLSKDPKSRKHWDSELVSLKTAAIKVLSSGLGILAGASIGREGPTVQIAASGFAWTGRNVRKLIPQADFQAYLIAGAAAGVAAAFNTPLAGITFALEEIAGDAFGFFRSQVMLAVIVSGITAQALIGDYLYFGHPDLRAVNWGMIPQALLIGSVGGLLGALFAKLLAEPSLTRLPKRVWPRALLCGVICAIIGFITHGDTAGSGYEVTKTSLAAANSNEVNVFFPILKLITTVLSYLSGMAGGIFSPCLSIGAALGMSIAHLAHWQSFKACALMGMVAFFSGAVQAPLTAVVIVMEMTDEHILILPFMVSAFLAHGLGRWIMPVPLYSFLAGKKEAH